MTIYVLKAGAGQAAWEPWYDKAFGFVVRAENEYNARLLASKDAGCEEASAWLDPAQSSCEELASNGEGEVIMRDFASA